MGRPIKKIDYDLVTKLAMIQCTEEEIAHILEITPRTLQKNKKFLRIFHGKKKAGKSSLRRMQWKAAEDGNATILIWLGKQYLGQSNEVVMKHSGSIDHNVQAGVMVVPGIMDEETWQQKIKEWDKETRRIQMSQGLEEGEMGE